MPSWIIQIGAFLLQSFENSFPNIAGAFASLVSNLPKQTATLLHNSLKFFHDQIAAGADWETAATATLNELGTEAYKDFTADAKHLLQAAMEHSKPAAAS
jgi:hypothetical protein